MRSLILLTLISSGCAVALTDAGSRVQVMKSDPPAVCREKGSVSGHAGVATPSASTWARNDLRNQAANAGANYVRLESISGRGEQGTAYLCPTDAAAQ